MSAGSQQALSAETSDPQLLISNPQMQTAFVTAEVELATTPSLLREAIETVLRLHGEPLRWAIVSVDAARQTVAIEAVVILEL